MKKNYLSAENDDSQQIKESRRESDQGISFHLPTDTSIGIIKVVGVGGGGCNAVRNMYMEGITNVTYAACNTDSQQLVRCPVPVKLQLGVDGLGAGGNPEKGREEAEFTRDRIRELLDDGTKMVFVTASMGGGTGTGAAPIIAQVAKEMGILTIGIVTIPFSFEGKQKILKALRGMEEMRRNVDALLVVQNDKLTGGAFRELPDGERQRIPMRDKFKEADNILKDAAKSISELITMHTDGDINLDFRDVETTMKNGGDAIMAAGRASGEHRVERAIIQALDSPLLYGSDIGRARRILVDIYTSDEEPREEHVEPVGMVASARLRVGAQLAPFGINLARLLLVVLDGVAEVIGIDKILSGVVGRVDVDHLHALVVRTLKEFQHFKVVALDVEVPGCVPVLRLLAARTQRPH